MLVYSKEIFGYPIRAECKSLDEGWDIAIYGGSRTHVGAVTLAQPGESPATLERPEHRDAFISEQWAVKLAKELKCPVCVRCGIHYDDITKEQVQAIAALCSELLEEFVLYKEQNREEKKK